MNKMCRRNLLKAVALALLITACNTSSGATDNEVGRGEGKHDYPAYPTPNLTTPDNALKSYWAYQNHWRLIDSIKWSEVDYKARAEQNVSVWSAVTAGAALEWWGTISPPKRSTFSREIISVKQETETRAVIISKVRNTTPYPHYISQSDMKERRDGKRIDYVLEKDSTGWKVVQARFTYFSDPEESDIYFEETQERPQTYVSP